MNTIKTEISVKDLFGHRQDEAFDQGYSSHLISNRNNHLGSLFTAERGIFYIQILYRMFLFKRAHELEPLYEDIFKAVVNGLEQTKGGEYSSQQFLIDMRQLEEWQLISFRIEKERLRGYRDNRKRKFRYTLSQEAAAMLQWLENRLLNDLDDRSADARDLLQEVCGTLNELLRLLHHLARNDTNQADMARRILFQLFKVDDFTQMISVNLIEFNGRLLFFLLHSYDITLVRQIIGELDSYVDSFLNQIYKLGQEIIPLTDRLRQDINSEKLDLCYRIMEEERLQAPHFMQGDTLGSHQDIPKRLHLFFIENGGLDQLHRRIGRSVIQVWQKLRSHLRELERKNNRLEDLRSRIDEIATLDEDQVPTQFFFQLLAPARICCDTHYWDAFEKADPPEPRRQLTTKKPVPRVYLKKKKETAKPVQTMDEARLDQLDHWLRDKVLYPDKESALVSQGNYSEHQDFNKIMELAMAGYLNKGKRLERIHFSLNNIGQETSVSVARQKLVFPEMETKKDKNNQTR